MGANTSQVRDGYFTVTSNGRGSFGNITITGAMANEGNSQVTETLSGVIYYVTNSNGSISMAIEIDSSATPVYELSVVAPAYRSFRMRDLYTPE